MIFFSFHDLCCFSSLGFDTISVSVSLSFYFFAFSFLSSLFLIPKHAPLYPLSLVFTTAYSNPSLFYRDFATQKCDLTYPFLFHRQSSNQGRSQARINNHLNSIHDPISPVQFTHINDESRISKIKQVVGLVENYRHDVDRLGKAAFMFLVSPDNETRNTSIAEQMDRILDPIACSRLHTTLIMWHEKVYRANNPESQNDQSDTPSAKRQQALKSGCTCISKAKAKVEKKTRDLKDENCD